MLEQRHRRIGFSLFPLIYCATVTANLIAPTGWADDAPAARAVTATAYDISVTLDPTSHRLVGKATLSLRLDPPAAADEPVALDFSLNRALELKGVAAKGGEASARVVTDRPDQAAEAGEDSSPPLLVTHRVQLDSPTTEFELSFDYAGELYQDVEAGERPGQLHNFEMAAHVGTEGIYLDASGGWYPFPAHDPDAPRRGELATYHLTANPVEGMKLVAGASFDEQASARSGRLTWTSKHPADGLALVGGPYLVKQRKVGDIDLALLYSLPRDERSRAMIERTTDLFLEKSTSYLERYQPLIGPYPFEHFSIVQNFFSSGFAFPEFTLLDQRLFRMGPGAVMHGMLDHEMLHAWWGNSVQVDPADGNWCEALTSYATNHTGYILDGEEEGARNYRRNACISFSVLKPEEDKPLGTFGRKDGAGRDIGYAKGAVVFHMIARKIGQDNFWSAMRRLTAEYTGKYADWKVLQTLFEEEGDAKLDRLFAEWVRASGAPSLSIRNARWHAAEQTLELTLDQGATAFELEIPLRLVQDDGTSVEKTVAIDRTEATVRLRLDAPPSTVVVDPDYHVFRKLKPNEIMPTSKTTQASEKLLVVKPDGELSRFYQTVIDRFSDEKEPEDITLRTASELESAALQGQSLLILGDAVRNGAVRALLARTDCPVTWTDAGFAIDGVAYDQAGQSVFYTVHHPDLPGAGVTVYYGNSETALGRSDLLLRYRNSLVAFDTSSREVEGETQYQSQVIARRDFEPQTAIEVER